MTYASANRRPNAAALAGALGIPGAFGALLVVVIGRWLEQRILARQDVTIV